MKIATLQFSPKLGLVDENIAHADFLLSSSRTPLNDLHLLVLPELAFTGITFLSLFIHYSDPPNHSHSPPTGYNHPSFLSIKPHLEPTCAGRTTQWAIRTAHRLQCLVTVGYPELFSPNPPPPQALKPTMINLGREPETYYTLIAYNSTVTVNPRGEIVSHYRKTHLYYTDEVWAQESPTGFTTTDLHFPLESPVPNNNNAFTKGTTHTTTHAICMDLNPHHFLRSTTTASPLCTHVLSSKSTLLLLSTAWLTHLPSSSLAAHPSDPDMDTLAYWFNALSPLIAQSETEIVCVFANRCGEEPGRAVPDVMAGKDEEGEGEGVRYAGSSWVGKVGVGGDRVVVGGLMGRGEEGVLVVETEGLDEDGRGWRLVRRENGKREGGSDKEG